MQIRCQREWRLRATNPEADVSKKDALSKKDFGCFRSELRLDVRWEDILLTSMLEFADFGHHFQAIRCASDSDPFLKRKKVTFEKSHWG